MHIGLIFLTNAAIVQMMACPVLGRPSTIKVSRAAIVARALGVLLVKALLLGLGWLLHGTGPHYLRFLFLCVVVAVVAVSITFSILILATEVSNLGLSLRIILLVERCPELSRCLATVIVALKLGLLAHLIKRRSVR